MKRKREQHLTPGCLFTFTHHRLTYKHEHLIPSVDDTHWMTPAGQVCLCLAVGNSSAVDDAYISRMILFCSGHAVGWAVARVDRADLSIIIHVDPWGKEAKSD